MLDPIRTSCPSLCCLPIYVCNSLINLVTAIWNAVCHCFSCCYTTPPRIPFTLDPPPIPAPTIYLYTSEDLGLMKENIRAILQNGGIEEDIERWECLLLSFLAHVSLYAYDVTFSYGFAEDTGIKSFKVYIPSTHTIVSNFIKTSWENKNFPILFYHDPSYFAIRLNPQIL